MPELEPPPSDPAAAAPPEQPEGGQAQAGPGEEITVGDARWIVVGAKKKNELMPQGSGAVRQGDFVVVNFEYTNNSDGPVTLRPSSMGIIEKGGRRFEVMDDMEGFVPPDRDPFSRPVDPGATLTGRAIFAVTPQASGFRLQLGDGQPFPPENAYVDLGF